MTRKWNQFVSQKIRTYGKTDDFDLITVRNYLRIEHELESKKEKYLLFDKYDGHLVRVNDYISEFEAHKYKIHWVDIIIFELGQVACLVEVDGKIHNIKIKKTNDRNEDYTIAQIPFIIINKEDIKELQKTKIICWKEHLYEQLESNKLI